MISVLLYSFLLATIETLLGEFAEPLCSSSQKSNGRTSKWTVNKIDGLFISFNPWPGRWGEKAPLPYDAGDCIV